MLSVPWALDVSGRLVSPTAAKRGERYVCPNPECGSRLAFKAGEVVTWHFAHLDDTRCTEETFTHWAAKHMLATVVQDAILAVGKQPSIWRRCTECGDVCPQELPRSVRAVRLESWLGTVRPDVLLLGDNDVALCAIEVYHSHAVDGLKAARLTIPWLELDAAAVLRHPYDWYPRQDHLRPLKCSHPALTEDVEPLAGSNDREYLVRFREIGGRTFARHYRFDSMRQAVAIVGGWLAKSVKMGKRPRSMLVVVTIRSRTEQMEETWRNQTWLRRPRVTDVAPTGKNRLTNSR